MWVWFLLLRVIAAALVTGIATVTTAFSATHGCAHFTVTTAGGYTSISFVLRGVLPPVAFWHLTAALTQEVALVFLVETTPKGFVLLSTPAKPTLFEALS